MKIHYTHIKGYKNLKDFRIDFNAKNKDISTVLVGQNATGKSNFLEALVHIFRSLYLYEKTDFFYEIEYECRNKTVKIISNPDAKKQNNRTLYWVNNLSVTKKHFEEHSGKNRKFKNEERTNVLFSNNEQEILDYLPDHIFAYYSGLGNNNRLEELFDRFQRIFRDELLQGKSTNDNPEISLPFLFFAKLVHSYFALLSFFAYENKDANNAKQFLKDIIKIQQLDSLLFVTRERIEGEFKKMEGSNPKFWDARGEVAKFLDRLYDIALAPMRGDIKVRLGEFKTPTKKALYLYLPNIKDLENLASSYKDEADFFKYLNSMYMSDLLHEIQVFLKKPDSDDDLSFKDLSEGEQQLLVVLGLLRFFRQKECLFLLDEPDTHLNPMWKYHYLYYLREIAGQSPKSQILMTSHEALVVNGLKKESIKIFKRDSKGEIITQTPEKDMIGLGMEEILTSDTFGLTTTLDRETYKKVLHKRKIYADLKKQLSDKERKELQEEVREIEDYLDQFGL